MAYEHKEGTGSLFVTKDEQRQKSKNPDNFPDYSGSAMFNGEEIYISGWKKSTPKGETYLSLSIRPVPVETKKTSAPLEPRPKPAKPDGF
jgi:hypothetical protein